MVVICAVHDAAPATEAVKTNSKQTEIRILFIALYPPSINGVADLVVCRLVARVVHFTRRSEHTDELDTYV